MQSVIHLVSGDGTEQETSLAITENLLNDETGSIDDVVVVVQAAGMEVVTTDGPYEDRVRSLMENGVTFKACRNTLEMQGMDESDIVAGIETVPEGAVEVTRLESDGFAYLRP